MADTSAWLFWPTVMVAGVELTPFTFTVKPGRMLLKVFVDDVKSRFPAPAEPTCNTAPAAGVSVEKEIPVVPGSTSNRPAAPDCVLPTIKRYGCDEPPSLTMFNV